MQDVGGSVASAHDKAQRELRRIPPAFGRRVSHDSTAAFAAPEEWRLGVTRRPQHDVPLSDQSQLLALKAEYRARFGAQLNADNASELFAEYSASLTTRALFGLAVRAAAGRVVDSLLLDLLKHANTQPLIVFTAGGNGAGKTSSLVPAADSEASIQFDSTFSLPTMSIANVERARGAGFSVLVVLVWRDPVDALVNGTLPRAMRIGRTVPLSSHVRTHLGAPRTVIEVLDRFGSDEGVTVAIFENASTGGEAGLIRRDRAWLESLRRPVAAELLRELRERLERERQAGRINAAVYEGTMSPEARGE